MARTPLSTTTTAHGRSGSGGAARALRPPFWWRRLWASGAPHCTGTVRCGRYTTCRPGRGSAKTATVSSGSSAPPRAGDVDDDGQQQRRRRITTQGQCRRFVFVNFFFRGALLVNVHLFAAAAADSRKHHAGTRCCVLFVLAAVPAVTRRRRGLPGSEFRRRAGAEPGALLACSRRENEST